LGLDARLDLWWDTSKERWKVMEWIVNTGRWSYCLFWQGPGGEYRGLDGSVEPLLLALAEADWARYGTSDGAHLLHGEAWDSARRERMERRRREALYLRRHTLEDILARGIGAKIVSGSGGLRSRGLAGYRDALRDAGAELARLERE
jgi:hypothetical protein